jgi:hypothetical protein
MYSRAKSATFRNVKRGYSEEIIFCKIRNLIICEILKQANGNLIYTSSLIRLILKFTKIFNGKAK